MEPPETPGRFSALDFPHEGTGQPTSDASSPAPTASRKIATVVTAAFTHPTDFDRTQIITASTAAVAGIATTTPARTLKADPRPGAIADARYRRNTAHADKTSATALIRLVLSPSHRHRRRPRPRQQRHQDNVSSRMQPQQTDGQPHRPVESVDQAKQRLLPEVTPLHAPYAARQWRRPGSRGLLAIQAPPSAASTMSGPPGQETSGQQHRVIGEGEPVRQLGEAEPCLARLLLSPLMPVDPDLNRPGAVRADPST
jgi:hypothetical protein